MTHPHDILAARLDAFRDEANTLIDAADAALHEGTPGAYQTYFFRMSRSLLDFRLATDKAPKRSACQTTTYG